MRYALVNNIKKEASTGLVGTCPGCLQPVIARCGEQRVHHWAHSRVKMCDTWWEAETEWHREWKNKFPKDWQEHFLPDPTTGEKHIADIRADNGFVIEFQHSHMHPHERHSREAFYKNMVWVVDGTRLKRDYPRFLKGKNSSKLLKKGIFEIDYPEDYLPAAWLNSLVPVLFDFHRVNKISGEDKASFFLYCLFPVKIRGRAIIAEIAPNAFISSVISGEWLARTEYFIKAIIKEDKEQKDQLDRIRMQLQGMMPLPFTRRPRYRRGRRF